MNKYILALSLIFLISGCANRHGVSAKYYSDCKEYYDLQGYYHNECGEDDIFTYKGVGDWFSDVFSFEEEKPKGNVW